MAHALAFTIFCMCVPKVSISKFALCRSLEDCVGIGFSLRRTEHLPT